MVANRQPADHELRLLFWETTAGCNLECVHCRRLDVSKQLMQNDLTLDQARAFLGDLASFARPILVLSGGEPLFRRDIFDIAAVARDAGLPVALATNGTLVNDAIARRIVDSGIKRVAISIDGADALTHDSFRKQEGSLAAALGGIRHLRRLGMSLQINCTVTRHNVHQIDQLYDLALAEGVDAMHLFMLVPVGCGVQIAESNMLPAAEYERVLNWMYDKSQLDQIHLKATCAPHYFRVMKQRQVEERREKREEGAGTAVPSDVVRGSPDPAHPPTEGLPAVSQETVRSAGSAGSGDPRRTGAFAHHGPSQPNMAAMTKGCLAGSSICFVSHTGEVFPCGYLPVSAGNVTRQPIREIWENAPVFTRLRDVEQLEGKCGWCEFKKICLGCRARAYYETGDYMAEEPYCVYEPVRWRKQKEIAAL